MYELFKPWFLGRHCTTTSAKLDTITTSKLGHCEQMGKELVSMVRLGEFYMGVIHLKCRHNNTLVDWPISTGRNYSTVTVNCLQKHLFA